MTPPPSLRRGHRVCHRDHDRAEDWDSAASTFDEDADHGLRDPAVRAAWAGLLLPLLPEAPAAVLDVGCGTGSLSVLLAEAGHSVQVIIPKLGIDEFTIPDDDSGRLTSVTSICPRGTE